MRKGYYGMDGIHARHERREMNFCILVGVVRVGGQLIGFGDTALQFVEYTAYSFDFSILCKPFTLYITLTLRTKPRTLPLDDGQSPSTYAVCLFVKAVSCQLNILARPLHARASLLMSSLAVYRLGQLLTAMNFLLVSHWTNP
jgi:hypothetical protein